MSPLLARSLTGLGLLLSLAGLILLFYYGMPFHLPIQGRVAQILDTLSHPDAELGRIYTRNGNIGFACLIAGTLLQMAALWPLRSK